ncbi:transmembrane protein 30C [Cricetulus griseus]
MECFLTQPKETKKETRKTKKWKKKKISEILAKSEPKPGTPGDLQQLIKDHYSGSRSVIELEELNLPVCPKWVKLRKTHSEKKSVLMLIMCSSAVRALELIRSLTAFKGDAKVMKLFAKHIKINYTNICANCAQLREDSSNFDKECTCSVPFYLPENMEGNVYMYYKLYGFHQNLYRYILSRSNRQLLGKDIWDVKDCSPFQVSRNSTPIIPCGAIANSIFNDTITLSYNLNSSIHIEVPMLKSGLAWWTDKYVKFQNPRASDLASAFAGSAKPLHWTKPVYELDTDDPGNNGFVNEDLIVWMRTAAFPTFKKLYRRLKRVDYFAVGLPAGNYSFNISYSILLSHFLFSE